MVIGTAPFSGPKGRSKALVMTPDKTSLFQQKSQAGGDDRSVDEAVAALRVAIRDLRFGSVSIKFHDAKVVQLEITEKSLL